MNLSSQDVAILGVGGAAAVLYLFRDQIFSSKTSSVPVPTTKSAAGEGNPRDFVAKMKAGVCRLSPVAENMSLKCLIYRTSVS